MAHVTLSRSPSYNQKADSCSARECISAAYISALYLAQYLQILKSFINSNWFYHNDITWCGGAGFPCLVGCVMEVSTSPSLMPTVREQFVVGFWYERLMICRSVRFFQVCLYHPDNDINGKRRWWPLLSLGVMLQKMPQVSFLVGQISTRKATRKSFWWTDSMY